MPYPQDQLPVPLSTAAYQLKMSYGRVWRLVVMGDLAGRQIGGRWFVEREGLAKALASQSPASDP